MQLSLDKKQLAALLPGIAQDYLGTSVQGLLYLGGGTYGRVFAAQLADGSKIALKAYRTNDMHETEANQLKMLAANTSVPMPQVLFVHSDESLAVLGMSFIPGRNVLDPRFLLKNASAKKKFAQDTAQGLLELHSTKGTKYGGLQNPTHTSWLAYYKETIAEDILTGLGKLAAEGKYSAKRHDLLCRGYERFEQAAEEPETPVLVHGDLNIMNIMAEPKTLALTGFIDPCGTMWADRDYDLFQLQNMWGNQYGLYETYTALCGASPHRELKVAFYGALNEAACILRAGVGYEIWQQLWNRRLQAQLERYQ